MVIQGAIAAAPKVLEALAAAKQFVSGLFGAGLIDAATQDKLHAHCDEVAMAFIRGEVPPAWTVEPDPVGAPVEATTMAVSLAKLPVPSNIPPSAGVTVFPFYFPLKEGKSESFMMVKGMPCGVRVVAIGPAQAQLAFDSLIDQRIARPPVKCEFWILKVGKNYPDIDNSDGQMGAEVGEFVWQGQKFVVRCTCYLG